MWYLNDPKNPHTAAEVAAHNKSVTDAIAYTMKGMTMPKPGM